MRHEGKEAYRGFMEEYDLDQNFVIVNVCAYLDVHVGILQHSLLDSVPYGEACVVGRGLSGDLMARSVELGGDLRVSNNDKDLDSKTAEVHWHDDMSILFYFFYYMHVGNNNEFYFIFNSCPISLAFCSNLTLLLPLLCY